MRLGVSSLNSRLVVAIHVASLSIGESFLGPSLTQTLGGAVKGGSRRFYTGWERDSSDATTGNGRRCNNSSNVPETLAAKIGRDLHRQPGHPLCLIKNRCVCVCGGLVRWRPGGNTKSVVTLIVVEDVLFFDVVGWAVV